MDMDKDTQVHHGPKRSTTVSPDHNDPQQPTTTVQHPRPTNPHKRQKCEFQRPPQTSKLAQLPQELQDMIASNLDRKSLHNLSQQCKPLQYTAMYFLMTEVTLGVRMRKWRVVPWDVRTSASDKPLRDCSPFSWMHAQSRDRTHDVNIRNNSAEVKRAKSRDDFLYDMIRTFPQLLSRIRSLRFYDMHTLCTSEVARALLRAPNLQRLTFDTMVDEHEKKIYWYDNLSETLELAGPKLTHLKITFTRSLESNAGLEDAVYGKAPQVKFCSLKSLTHIKTAKLPPTILLGFETQSSRPPRRPRHNNQPALGDVLPPNLVKLSIAEDYWGQPKRFLPQWWTEPYRSRLVNFVNDRLWEKSTPSLEIIEVCSSRAHMEGEPMYEERGQGQAMKQHFTNNGLVLEGYDNTCPFRIPPYTGDDDEC